MYRIQGNHPFELEREIELNRNDIVITQFSIDNYLNSYVSNGKLITYIVQEWDNSKASWVQQSKTDYVVSTAGNRLTETYVDKDYPSKTEYSYDTSAVMSSFVHPFKA